MSTARGNLHAFIAQWPYTPEDLRDRQARPRERRRLPEFVFGEHWGEPAAFLDPEPED